MIRISCTSGINRNIVECKETTLPVPVGEPVY